MTLDVDQVARKVKAKVERWNEGRHDRPLTVDERSVLLDPGSPADEPWYYVVVRESGDVQHTDYYYILNVLENELLEEDRLNVLLVPVIPPDIG